MYCFTSGEVGSHAAALKPLLRLPVSTPLPSFWQPHPAPRQPSVSSHRPLLEVKELISSQQEKRLLSKTSAYVLVAFLRTKDPTRAGGSTWPPPTGPGATLALCPVDEDPWSP